MLTKWDIFLLLLLASQVKSQLRASYDEDCGDGIRCDSKKSLSCVDSKCKCMKQDEMMYDTLQNKCVVLAGERCSYTAIEVLTDTTQEKRWTERLDCVKNAVCNNDGYCGCQANLYENSAGTCSPKRVQGQNCTTDNHCRTDLHLTCELGICQCNSSEAIYDRVQKTCIGIVGASCGKYGTCVRNAYCYSRRYGYGSSSSERCQCDSSYLKSKDGLCLASYDMSCDQELSPCTEQFACTDSRCKCHYPDHQEGSSCISFVRGPCQEEIGNATLKFRCVEHATCKNSKGIYECQCKDGYIESSARNCKLAHGQPCKTTNQCDTTANLVCKYGTCSCKDFGVYDSVRNECRGSVGAQCNTNTIKNNYCLEGAFCDKYRDSGLGTGSCRCFSSFLTSSDRKCLPPLPVILATSTSKSTANYVNNDTTLEDLKVEWENMQDAISSDENEENSS